MAHIFHFLDTVGDGSGTQNANVDGSSTPQVFKYVPQAGSRIDFHRMLVHIVDTGPLSADNYGGLGGALTNGILVQVRRQEDDSTVIDLLDGNPIKSNGAWGRVCYDVDLDSFGSGKDFINVRWTFSRAGAPLSINDELYLCIVVQDNLTALDEHYFMVQGLAKYT